MKYQNIFSGKSEKNISKCHLLNFLPSMLSFKSSVSCPQLHSDSYIAEELLRRGIW